MDIQAKVTKDRGKNGQNASDKLNIELLDEGGNRLAWLIFKHHPKEVGRYVLAEDMFFRSPKLAVHASRELTDSPVGKIVPLSCLWCRRRATVRQWRILDGIAISAQECSVCSKQETATLLGRAAKKEAELKTASFI